MFNLARIMSQVVAATRQCKQHRNSRKRAEELTVDRYRLSDVARSTELRTIARASPWYAHTLGPRGGSQLVPAPAGLPECTPTKRPSPASTEPWPGSLTHIWASDLRLASAGCAKRKQLTAPLQIKVIIIKG